MPAYTSGHSGEYHIYVEAVPSSGRGPAQVSLTGGAEEPRWSADGRLLYYRSGRRIMVNINSFFFGWRLSPEDNQIAYTANSGGSFDIWVKDLPAGLGRQLTFEGVEEYLPWWTPDGQQVTYLRGPGTSREVWARNVDGTGQPVQLMDGDPPIGQGVWSDDGTWLVLRTFSNTGPGPRDVVAFRPGVDTSAIPILASPEYGEEHPALSPDGRWLAYTSERTSPNGEVFVSPFPNVEQGRWPISQGGGFAPVWAHSGRELFFVNGDLQIVSASVETEPTFRVRALDPLFTLPPDFRYNFFANFYDVSRDDQRFLMGRAYGADAGEGQDRYVLVQNFNEELNRLVPPT